jgi:cellulase/cellobiase CelA1
MTRLLLAAATAAALLTFTAQPAHAIAPSPAVTCQFVIDNSWPGGYMADIIITNHGSAPVTGWTVNWSIPRPIGLGTTWSAYVKALTPQDFTATSFPWNNQIPGGARASFGWTAIAPQVDFPTVMTFNGAEC